MFLSNIFYSYRIYFQKCRVSLTKLVLTREAKLICRFRIPSPQTEKHPKQKDAHHKPPRVLGAALPGS